MIERSLVEMRLDHTNVATRIERQRRVACGARLVTLEIGHAVSDLSLQIGKLNCVGIGQDQVANAGSGQVERYRRAQPTGAYHQYPRGQQALLPLDVDRVQHDLPAVAQQRLVVHGHYLPSSSSMSGT